MVKVDGKTITITTGFEHCQIRVTTVQRDMALALLRSSYTANNFDRHEVHGLYDEKVQYDNGAVRTTNNADFQEMFNSNMLT